MCTLRGLLMDGDQIPSAANYITLNVKSFLAYTRQSHRHSPYTLPQGISAFWVSIQTIHKVRHGEVKVLSSDTIL